MYVKTNAKNSPLGQVNELCSEILRTIGVTGKCFIEFFCETMLLFLTMQCRVNYSTLARFGKSCESRFRQNFKKSFDWMAFNKTFVESGAENRRAIAIDPSYVSKSGKHTPGVGYFWSGCASAAKWGLELLGIALVDADDHRATMLRAVQTIKKKRGRGRPTTAQSFVKDNVLLTCYVTTLELYKDELLEVSKNLVADAFFSTQPFTDAVLSLGFNFISRFRDRTRMRYLYQGEHEKRRGPKKTYDGLVDINNLRNDVFLTEELDWDDHKVTVHSAVVNVIALKRNVKVVIVDFNEQDKKTQTRKIFFSTDTNMSAKDIIDIYRSRFLIEFCYRDAKEYTALTNCQSRLTASLDFAFNMSFAAVNMASLYCRKNGIEYSLSNIKLLMHNAQMLEKFISICGKTPHMKLIRGSNDSIFKDLLLYGLRKPA